MRWRRDRRIIGSVYNFHSAIIINAFARHGDTRSTNSGKIRWHTAGQASERRYAVLFATDRGTAHEANQNPV
jgi:hypothetical protein